MTVNRKQLRVEEQRRVATTPGYSWNLLEMDLPPGKTPGNS